MDIETFGRKHIKKRTPKYICFCVFFFPSLFLKNHPKFNCCTCKNAEGCCKNDCFLKINTSSLRGIQCQGGEEGDSFYKREEKRQKPNPRALHTC